MYRLRRPVAALVALAPALVAQAPTPATAPTAATSAVFRRFAPYVEKIQIVQVGSSAKNAIGSGFFVTDAGHLVTNYHVVSDVINHPGRYRAELVETDGRTEALTVVAVDVVHDLAIVRTPLRGKPHFTIANAVPAQGERLFSLGNPHDLGLSIVEGTYNGLVQNTLYPRIHLTAPINPGMSGGPTIDESGRVIGVNVATAGEEVGFLVPVRLATALLRSALAGDTAVRPTQRQMGEQLRRNQAEFRRDLLGPGTPRLDLGPFRVVTQPAPYFHCWGSATRDPEQPSETVSHSCSMEEDIYLDEDQNTGSVNIEHKLVRSRTLNMARFYARYSTVFGADDSPDGDEEYVTSWQCVTRNVHNAQARMRAVTCLRRYKHLGALYDAHVKLAVLGRSNVGLVSTLNVSGATYDTVTLLAQRFLDSVSWR